MTLATVVYQVCDEVGINRPAPNIPAATDLQTVQLRALMLRTGQRLVEQYEWSDLIAEWDLTVSAGTPNYNVPADFQRFIDDTQWNTSNRVPLFGPQSQQDWAQNQFGMINVGPFFRQQLRGTQLWLQPTPVSTQVLGSYYISTNWIMQNGTAPATTFASDSDTFQIRDDVLVANLKWRWLRAKRLSYDEERDEADSLTAQASVQDRGARQLSMDPQREQFKPRYGFVVPITGFGQ